MVAIEPTPARERRAKEYTDFAHTGPGTLAGRYLRLYWQPVMKSADLEAGHAKPIRILSEDFTLYRGEGGAPHVVAYRCAHRGTQLSTGWVEGDCIRCFYHGWKYDHTGQCVEMPAEDPSFPPKVKIKSYPTEEYLGLIWAYLGEGEAPPLRRFPQLEEERPSEGVVRQTLGGNVLPFNYVNNLENDPAHVPFVHRSTAFFQDIPQVESEETEYGSRESVTTEARGFIGYVHRIMPNTRLFTIPVPDGGWAEFFLWLVPVDDAHHMGFGVLMNHLTPEAQAKFRERGAGKRWLPRNAAKLEETAAAVLRGELRIEEVEDKSTIELVQDMVSQWGQGVIRDREHERLGRSDRGVILLRGLWERELRALAESRPLKQWTIPERLELSPTYHG
ncbi:MAG TPA: Rieske 2Fe-2S domain-containing protein [Chloroflexota bacterium]|nr:Rieske 2Fe-2S domain-containing protein [Chloroflexota bacterium]